MKTIRTILLLTLLWASASRAELPPDPPLPPPLPCPHCGKWVVEDASPGGLTGERISINQDSIDISTCGFFDVTATQQSISEGFDKLYGNYRIYNLKISLIPSSSLRPLCNSEDDDTGGGSAMRMEIKIWDHSHNRYGGVASFYVFKNNQKDPVISATAWNPDRDNPCDATSGLANAACHRILIAQAYKALAYEVYETPPKASSVLNRKFNVASFASASLQFCLKREEKSGAGYWPYAWAQDCQLERIESKLNEVRAWRNCVSEKGVGKCKTPTNHFDRSIGCGNDEPPELCH